MTKRIALPLVAALVLSAASALSTTVLAIDFPTLVGASDWIVVATVTGVTNNNTDTDTAFTDVALDIREVLHATSKLPTTTLRLPGGTMRDGRVMAIPGLPGFSKGERVVLFLEASPLGFVPTGLGQGVFRLTTSETGPEVATQDLAGVHRVTKEGTPAERAPMRLPLKELTSQIAGMVGGAK